MNGHDARIRAFALASDEPIRRGAFDLFLDLLRSAHGPKLLRVKGLICVAEDPDHPVVSHGVQHVFHPPVELERWPSEDRRTRMVFITRRIDPEELRGTLALKTMGLSDVQFEGLVERVAADMPG